MENKYKTIFYGVSAIVYLAITIYYIVEGSILSLGDTFHITFCTTGDPIKKSLFGKE